MYWNELKLLATPVRFTRLSLSEEKGSNKPDRCNSIISSEGKESNKPVHTDLLNRCNVLANRSTDKFRTGWIIGI